MRKWSGVTVADLSAAYESIAAAEDARLAEAFAAMATWREALGPNWRPASTERRRVPATLYGPAPLRAATWIPVSEPPPVDDDEMIGWDVVDDVDTLREYEAVGQVDAA